MSHGTPALEVVLVDDDLEGNVARLEGRRLYLDVNSPTVDRLWAVQGAAEVLLSRSRAAGQAESPPGGRHRAERGRRGLLRLVTR